MRRRPRSSRRPQTLVIATEPEGRRGDTHNRHWSAPVRLYVNQAHPRVMKTRSQSMTAPTRTPQISSLGEESPSTGADEALRSGLSNDVATLVWFMVVLQKGLPSRGASG
jgi:hypothetical protein